MIYIFGGHGFIGSAFVRLFQKLNLEHKAVTRDNYTALRGTACDVFINANGNSSKPLATREPLRDFEASVQTTRATVEDFSFQRYIYLSSCEVYPDCSKAELTGEESLIDVGRQSPYGFHKLLAEQCVRHKADSWLIIRQGSFVGPGLKKNPIYDILYGNKIWLAPESELQFLHTDDSAALVWALYSQDLKNETFNLSGKGVVTVNEALQFSRRKIAREPDARIVRYNMSIEKAAKYLSIPESNTTVQTFMEAASLL